MIIKSPPASGAIEKPMAVNRGTFERRIFSVSAQSADVNVFMVLFVLYVIARAYLLFARSNPQHGEEIASQSALAMGR